MLFVNYVILKNIILKNLLNVMTALMRNNMKYNNNNNNKIFDNN